MAPVVDFGAAFGQPMGAAGYQGLISGIPIKRTYTPTFGFGAQSTGVIDYRALFDQWASQDLLAAQAQGSSPTGISPQYQFTFDTIGQTIFRTIGHCRTPLRIIWAQGIEASGEETTSSTISFAAAVCAPIDPEEEGTIVGISAGGVALFDSSGVTVPDGMTDATSALLNASISNAIVYPGDEAQEPAPLIVADKGASVTNAFRGIRYIVFPDWPLDAGLPSNMALRWERSNDITLSYTSAAVEFP